MPFLQPQAASSTLHSHFLSLSSSNLTSSDLDVNLLHSRVRREFGAAVDKRRPVQMLRDGRFVVFSFVRHPFERLRAPDV